MFFIQDDGYILWIFIVYDAHRALAFDAQHFDLRDQISPYAHVKNSSAHLR